MSPLTEPTKLILKSNNAPAAIAGVAPTLDYRFALDRRELDAVSLTDKLTVTRAATAAVNGPTGYLELAGPNVARFDHDLTTRQSLGLLVEEARTNILTNSIPLSSDWNIGDGTLFNNAGIAPDGTNTASRAVTFSSTFIQRNVAVQAGTSYVASFYAKVSSYNTPYFCRVEGLAFATGVAVDVTSIISDGNWARVSIPFTPDFTGNARIRLFSSNQVDALFWGVQVEVGSFPTSYIPTTATDVTRTESATIDGTGVVTGTYTMVEKPVGCAVVNGTNIDLQPGYTVERVMVFPTALSGEQITAIRSVM